jgi:phage terminase large subunit-like protein
VWPFWARAEQLEPIGSWTTWTILAGRGFGKTRAGAEWLRHRVQLGARRIIIVGRTAKEVRDVMIEGESGILAISPPWNKPIYEPGKSRITWPSGATATTFSADVPNSIRGNNIDTAWLDELASWKFAGKGVEHGSALAQVRFVMRSVQSKLVPRTIITTTPRPTVEIKELLSDPRSFITRGRTLDNAANLAPTYIEDLQRIYGGTRLGRQELDGDVLDDAPGALFKRSQIDALRIIPTKEELKKQFLQAFIAARGIWRVVVAVDPAFSTRETADETGIIVVGIDRQGHGYVLDDLSGRFSLGEWSRIVVDAYRNYRADRVIAEMNLNGEMVERTIRSIDPNISFKGIHAYRGKELRAEPVASLYEQGRVHHVGTLAKLEDQQCSWEPGVKMKSPDRLDATVYGLLELMVESDLRPGVSAKRVGSPRTVDLDSLSTGFE